MSRMPDNALVTLGPWPRGANNLAREDSVPANTFRRGVNVDVQPGGKVQRRQGRTLVDAMPTANMWSDGNYALCTSLDSTALYRFVPGEPMALLYTGLALDADIVYCAVNHLVYVSDGVIALRVDTSDDSVRPWGLPRPAGQPTLTAADGGLDPGSYQVCMTYATLDGEESGAGLASAIELDYGGGIRCTSNLPVPPGAAFIRLYVTRVNGGALLLYGQYPAGALDVTITTRSVGRELTTFGLEPLPAGTAAALVGGRLLVVAFGVLVWSQGLNFGQTNLATNYIQLPGHIRMLAPTSLGAAADGVFIGLDARTLFLTGGDIAQSNSRLAYAHGAQYCTPVYINGDEFEIDGLPSQPLPTWLATNGAICVGLPTGQVMALTGSRYETRVGDRATLAQRSVGGFEQLVVGVRNPSGDRGVASDSADSVLIRNGVELP